MATKPLYSFPAQLESLPAMLRHVRQQAGAVAPEIVLRAETVLEELLTNTAVHSGAASEPASVVWIAVASHGGGLGLRYEDAQAAFDPGTKIGEALRRTTHPLEQRPPGGLGLLMVYRLADEFRYTRENGRNCVDLAFQVRPVLS
jgi:anti-sigma regulatory factor (Ser/Thr protein kinase)